MKYDPDKHHRKSIRLKGFDYSSAGVYFVTICAKDRKCIFGKVQNGRMILNDLGEMVQYQWKEIPIHFQNVELDEFVVMPNHFHGILWLLDGSGNMTNPVGAKHSWQPTASKQINIARNASPLHPPNRPKGTKPGSLSAIIQNFTSITSRKINRIRKTPGEKMWQRNFYDRIVRNEKELYNLRNYIIDNPLKWENDEENPSNWKSE